MYRKLDPDRIIATLATLERRVSERFPASGLARVCAELVALAGESKEKAARAAAPHIPLRIATGLVIASGFALLGYVTTLVEVKRDADNLFGMLQGIEAFFNIVVLMGAAILFLVTLESRWKRQQALADLHELRSIVHIIDMHQLTKDPSTIATVSAPTPSSPKRDMTPFELTRYLDYCSEMLSLTAKVAALYAQSSKDPTVIAAATDLGQTTSNLSQKIWQKITIIEAEITRLSAAPPKPVPAAPAAKPAGA
jgi:hypothetical protein